MLAGPPRGEASNLCGDCGQDGLEVVRAIKMRPHVRPLSYAVLMSDNKNFTLDCAIVGGGISGLTAVHALHKMVPDWKIRLFEKTIDSAAF